MTEPLRAVQTEQDQAYLNRVRQSAVTDESVLALDFGGSEERKPWRVVGPDTNYQREAGFGWLPADDETDPTPEETYYGMASRYSSRIAREVTAGRLLFWPYRELPPAPLRTNLGCGTPRRFRIDVPAGDYTVRVVTTNPSWTNRNFFVSGMVNFNGRTLLLDTAHDKGALVSREIPVSAPDGKLELLFGGPTGWAVAALVVLPADRPETDPQVTGGLRTWRVSPRYANPDWYPIGQVLCSPEKKLESLPNTDWTAVEAPRQGLPVIDLGTNRQADVGDVVYAATTIDAPAARGAVLHFGATSQAQLWLNGTAIGYVPNEKGLRRDEFIVPLKLREGKNILVVKLQRFWEHRWMFSASVTEQD